MPSFPWCRNSNASAPMPPLWSQEKITQDENPNHYPKGSSNGGQFAPKKEGGNGLSISILPQKGAELEKPDLAVEKYSTPDFQNFHKDYKSEPYGFYRHHEMNLHTFFDQNQGRFPAGSPQWLQSHEGINNNHTIEKHVGKSIGYLKRRFKFNSRLDFASTFPDIETASKTIWKAIEENHDKIMKGLAKNSKKIEFTFEDEDFIGNVLKKGEKTPSQTKRIQVRLYPDPKSKGQFIIHTAYPIPEGK